MPKFAKQVLPVIITCLVAVFLSSCRQLSPEPKVQPSPPLTENYTEPSQHFSLQLPATWDGHYQVNSDGRTTFFNYLPEAGQPQMVFSVHTTTQENWPALAQNPKLLATELGSRGNTIYYAQTSPTNPYPSVDGQRYQQFSLDVPRILETFNLSP